MKSSQIDFGGSNLLQNCLRASIPIMGAQILNLLYNIVDRIYIGRIPGTGAHALGGVGLCFPVIMIITGLANLYGAGGAPLCAMERGKGKTEQAEHIMNTSFRLLILTAIITTLFILLICEPLMRLFGASDVNIDFAVSYMRVYILGTLFSMVSLGMTPFINSQGFASKSMNVILVGAILNIVLDPIFIFVFHLGIIGAALASVFSQIVSCILVMRFLLGKTAELKIHLQNLWHIDKSLTWEIVSLGSSSFVMQCTNSIVAIVCNKILSGYGGDLYVSVMTIINSERQIVSTPTESFCEGISPVLSYNYGAKNYDKVRKTIGILAAITMGYTFTAWILLSLFPHWFLHIFSHDSRILEVGIPAMKCYFAAFIFQTFQNIGQTVFKSLNKKKQAIFFSIFRKVIIVVPLTCLFPILGYGALGVFMAEPVSNVIGGLACFITMMILIMPELKNKSTSQSP